MSCYHVELLVMLFFLSVLCEMLTVMLFIWTITVRCSPVDSELGWKVNSLVAIRSVTFSIEDIGLIFAGESIPNFCQCIFITYLLFKKPLMSDCVMEIVWVKILDKNKKGPSVKEVAREGHWSTKCLCWSSHFYLPCELCKSLNFYWSHFTHTGHNHPKKSNGEQCFTVNFNFCLMVYFRNSRVLNRVCNAVCKNLRLCHVILWDCTVWFWYAILWIDRCTDVTSYVSFPMETCVLSMEMCVYAHSVVSGDLCVCTLSCHCIRTHPMKAHSELQHAFLEEQSGMLQHSPHSATACWLRECQFKNLP